PPAGLDLEQVGEGDVEGLRILAVDHGVLHLALLGEPSLPPAQVLAELAVERLLHRLVGLRQGQVWRAQRGPEPAAVSRLDRPISKLPLGSASRKVAKAEAVPSR